MGTDPPWVVLCGPCQVLCAAETDRHICKPSQLPILEVLMAKGGLSSGAVNAGSGAL